MKIGRKNFIEEPRTETMTQNLRENRDKFIVLWREFRFKMRVNKSMVNQQIILN